MGVLSTIGKLAGMVVGGIPGAIIGAGATLLDSDSKESSDGKPRLVAKPEPPKAFKSRDIGDFKSGLRSFAGDRKDARGAAGAGGTAIKSINPSERETRYWAAIFADAKRKSEIG